MSKIEAKPEETSWADSIPSPIEPSIEKIVDQVKNLSTESEEVNPLQQIKGGVSTFEDLGLNADLLKGVYSMGFTKPSVIQEKALPLLLANPPQNMIGQSQAGTGKTAAFVLTMLSRVDSSNPKTQAICLAPARELARQIMDNVREMGKYTSITTAFAIKDSVSRDEKISAHIIVGTPGTVQELIKKRQIETKDVLIFVLDEADNMLDQQGLGDQSLRIKNMLPKTAQIVLFSATFSEPVKIFAEKFAPNSHTLSLKVKELSVDGIKQFYMDCKSEEHKIDVLQAIYGLLTIGQSIIFVQKRVTADLVASKMKESGHTVFSLHGQFETSERDKVIDEFRAGKFKVLVTTNVISRGIDILSINVVINFDMPFDVNGRPDPETYLHRIGRTGRFGRTGVSINFVHDERTKNAMKFIQDHFGKEIVRVPTDSYMEIEKILNKAIK